MCVAYIYVYIHVCEIDAVTHIIFDVDASLNKKNAVK